MTEFSSKNQNREQKQAKREPNFENCDFRKIINELSQSKSISRVFADFCKVSACALSAQTREQEYLDTIKGYSKGEIKKLCQAFADLVNEMEAKPFKDLLGEFSQNVASKYTAQNNGEFYTPEHICDMMAHMALTDEQILQKSEPLTVCEPCCGSGRMILSLGKVFARTKNVDKLRVTAWDISPLACDITYINTTLWGIPTQVFHGDSLANKVHNSWKNIHWHRVGEDSRLKFNAFSDILKNEGKNNTELKECPKPDVELPLNKKDYITKTGKFTQMELDF